MTVANKSKGRPRPTQKRGLRKRLTSIKANIITIIIN
jgi:hypothetical protein